MAAHRAFAPTFHRRRWLSLSVLLIVICLISLFSTHGPTFASSSDELPPALEERAQSLYKKLMCPVCAGQTIAQSNAPISRSMREVVRDNLLSGESDQVIISNLVEAFGESILASPPKRGQSLIVWVVPPVTLLLGILVLSRVVSSMRQRHNYSEGDVTEDPTIRSEELAPYLALVDREIDDPHEN